MYILLPSQVTLQSPAVDPSTKEISYNPTYEELFAPQVRRQAALTTKWELAVCGTNDRVILSFFTQLGPANPHKTAQQRATKNMLSGYIEPSHINAFEFENQRRTFHKFGKCLSHASHVICPCHIVVM